LPAESSTVTTGWVVNAVAALELATPAVAVVKASLAAKPAVTLKLELVAVSRPFALALRV
jgi:hypothetical protein